MSGFLDQKREETLVKLRNYSHYSISDGKLINVMRITVKICRLGLVLVGDVSVYGPRARMPNFKSMGLRRLKTAVIGGLISCAAAIILFPAAAAWTLKQPRRG